MMLSLSPEQPPRRRQGWSLALALALFTLGGLAVVAALAAAASAFGLPGLGACLGMACAAIGIAYVAIPRVARPFPEE